LIGGIDMFKDIIDKNSELGYRYFDQSGVGYLRALLRIPKNYEKIELILDEDLKDIDILKKDNKNIEKLEKYFKKAKEFLGELIIAKEKTQREEEKVIEKEIKELEKDLKKKEISQEEYDFGMKILMKPQMDDLSYLKNKFEEFDNEIKRELKKEIEEDDEIETKFNEEPTEIELKKIEDEDIEDFNFEDFEKNPAYFEDKNQRFWSFNEYATIYEEMNQQQDQKKQQQTPQEKQIDIKRQQLRKQAIAAIITKNKKTGKVLNPNELNKMSDDELTALVGAD